MDALTGNSPFKSIRWLRTTRSLQPLHMQKNFYIFLASLLICTSLGFLSGAYWQSSKCNTPFGHVAKKFELDDIFTKAPSLEANAAWAGLIPRGRGFVVVDSTETPIPFTGGEATLAQVRAVSVYHQIHCLNELRLGYYANQALPTDHNATVGQAHGLHHSVNHIRHCFDYLRQSLTCASDTTLEKLQVDNGVSKSKPAVDGWGTTHRCRNYEEISKWASDHRASDAGGI